MPMFDPPHPGESLREDVLPAVGMNVSELARHLGYSRGNCPPYSMGAPPFLPILLIDLSWQVLGLPGNTLPNRQLTIFGKPLSVSILK